MINDFLIKKIINQRFKNFKPLIIHGGMIPPCDPRSLLVLRANQLFCRSILIRDVDARFPAIPDSFRCA